MTQLTAAPLIAAPFVGSFAGVLIRRLPLGRPVAWARSCCEDCGRRLGAAELVPVLSYALQRGRCRGCGAAIAPMHPAVELAALGIAVWAGTSAPDAGTTWALCGLGWTLLALAWIDARALLLPDVLTLPLLLAGLAATAIQDAAALPDRTLAAAIGFLAFRAVALAYRRLRKRDGLGEGDARLLAAAGAWVGLAGLPWVVLAAALGGIAWVLAWQAWRPGWRADAPIPFGTFLAMATWLVAVHGPDAGLA